jgi:uncharacterized protein (TIGR03435 family)
MLGAAAWNVRIVGVAVAICLLHGPAIRAQALRKFEVASLKPSPPTAGDKININLGSLSHGTLTLANASLADCLRYAYSLTNNEQLAGPEWIKSKQVRFDIIAKAPADAPVEQVRVMLQALLTERFQLALHREPKELSYVALVIGKKGSRLQEAIPDSDASANKFLIGRIVSNHISTTMLATLLSRFTGETVVDMTGLKGEYDLKLEWTPHNAPAAGTAIDAADGPSLFAAVERQLGLKLDVRKGPVEILVIDHAEKVPVQN